MILLTPTYAHHHTYTYTQTPHDSQKTDLTTDVEHVCLSLRMGMRSVREKNLKFLSYKKGIH